MTADAALLRRSLAANAAFSLVSGLVLALGSGPVARWTGLPEGAVLPAAGLGLVGWAAFVAWQASRPRPSLALARTIIQGDGLWVIGTVTGLALFGRELTPPGVIVIAITGAIVAVFGLGQWLGVRAVSGAPRSIGPT